MRRLTVPLAIAAALLALAGPAGGRQVATIHFSFRGYANNVKVVAPLVGPWQLGVARIHGSGTLVQNHLHGEVGVSLDPLSSRYKPASMRARVIGYYFQGAHGVYTQLTLTVEITGGNGGGPKCKPGTRGVISLYDSAAKLSNGEPFDYITIGHWAGRCPALVQGWTNKDGGPRTEPARGGLPDGGQWAVVSVSSS